MAVSGAKKRIDTALEARNIAWGGEKSAMCMVTTSWTFPFRKRSEMNWWPRVGLSPTMSFPRAAGLASI